MTRRRSGRSLVSQRTLLVAVLASAAVIPINAWLSSRSTQSWGTQVGDHVHALAAVRENVVVGGHEGGGSGTDSEWESIDSWGGRHVLSVAHSRRAVWAIVEDQLVTSSAAGSDGEYRAVDADWTERLTALGASNGVVYVADGGGGVWRSLDGEGFGLRTRRPSVQLVGEIGVDWRTPARAYGVGRDGELLKTEDGGRTWMPLDQVPVPIVSVAVSPIRPQDLVALTGEGDLKVTSDGGQTWSSSDGPEDLQAITFDAAGRLLAATSSDGRSLTFEYADGEWRAKV